MRPVNLPGLAALLGFALALGFSRGGGAAEAQKSPHGDPSGCLACHAPGASATEPGPALPIVKTCLGCHPTADMHPVSMAPNKVPVPHGWPLENGQVTCATCHAEPAHGGEFTELKAPWHRGGPYPSVTRFCYACHEVEGYARSNPHEPAKAGDPRDASCSACHTGHPPVGANLERSRLRVEASQVCTATCHTGAEHAGLAEHMGEEVSAEIAASLPDTMPLVEGKIACFTCHEVHGTHPPPAAAAKGALASGIVARARGEDWADLSAAGVSWPDGDDAHALLAASTADGSLCERCHGEGP